MVVTDASVIPSRCMQAVSAAHIWNLGQQMSSSKAPAGRTTAPDAELLSGVVHTGVEVHRMNSEISRLVE